MSLTKSAEIKVVVTYYDQETARKEVSPLSSKEVDSWRSAKAFNPYTLKSLSSKTINEGIKKLN
jgi:hypothetical protein